MADDKKIIFSMVGVSKMFPPHKQVLKDIYLSFFYGAKIGIIGLNGSGKSTLLKIIAGVEKSYQGEVVFSPGYSVGYLEQEPKLDPEKTVKEVVQEGVQPILDLLAEYEKVNESFGDPDVLEYPDKMEALIARQAELQDHIDASDAWNIDNKLERARDARRCPPVDQLVKFLSGGERRRVALCRLLLQQPDILLLDEPTNHLDAESIDWLEQGLEQPLRYAVRIGLLRIGFGLGIPIALFLLNPQGNHLLSDEMLVEALKSFGSCVAFPAWHVTPPFWFSGSPCAFPW